MPPVTPNRTHLPCSSISKHLPVSCKDSINQTGTLDKRAGSFQPVWALSVICSPLRRFAPFPLALSRFLQRAAAGACKNRSAAPLTAPCFCHWQRSLFVPPEGEPYL